MNSGDWARLKLPGMRRVQQRFESAPATNVWDEIDREWPRIHTGLDLPPGSKIAIGVGSRGISNLSVVVQAVVARLKEGWLQSLCDACHGVSRRCNGTRADGCAATSGNLISSLFDQKA